MTFPRLQGSEKTEPRFALNNCSFSAQHPISFLWMTILSLSFGENLSYIPFLHLVLWFTWSWWPSPVFQYWGNDPDLAIQPPEYSDWFKHHSREKLRDWVLKPWFKLLVPAMPETFFNVWSFQLREPQAGFSNTYKQES